ncbi:hypothetical protein EYF80_043217 [Liparis tanakae]|uniref:Uncharacterized protein n=1 Tax=Liparis tanakae TaxID=230148 RepID=A0A4Z2FZ44_9TELE|nr:hypothetical protein EYF80_043217 [Liparis tanakae]
MRLSWSSPKFSGGVEKRRRRRKEIFISQPLGAAVLTTNSDWSRNFQPSRGRRHHGGDVSVQVDGQVSLTRVKR